MLVVLATVSMLLTCNSGVSLGRDEMSIKRIDGQWVAWDKFGDTLLVGIGRSCEGALHALRNNMAELVCQK